MRKQRGDYERQVTGWISYDWANSAFTTTVLAAVLPVYYSSVAGATLPSAATATQYYSLTLSASVLVVAVLSPLLGAVADATGTRKRFLAAFAAVGIVTTAGLFAVNTGDWLLASVLFMFGRIGFSGANVFYDSLLPHVALPQDVDRVSARGFAFGYLGGGILLAANAVMILTLPDDNLGFRLSLLSVAVWWAVFSVPLLRRVPEPPGVGDRSTGEALRASIGEVLSTLRGLRNLPDLRRYLVAFLIYNDGIGTVVAAAAIYGVELGFDPFQLTLLILLVQFLGLPYSLLFGALPVTSDVWRRRFITAFLVANVVLLPVTGIALRFAGPAEVTGAAGPGIADEGSYDVAGLSPDDTVQFDWTGQSVELTYTAGPDQGELAVQLDGAPLLDSDGAPVTIDAFNATQRQGETVELDVATLGPHSLEVSAPGSDPPLVESIRVLPATRSSNLALILGAAVLTQLVAAAFAATIGGRLLAGLADRMTTKIGIMISLSAYVVVAVWGFALDSVVEFWFLAWLIGVVQGGSQALSRSLYARLIPDRRSGEFFGFFSILSKFASIVSPLLFVASVAVFESSRPAVLLLSVFFVTGMYLLAGVNVPRGAALADRIDADLRPTKP
ncbi:hypothetical protein BH24ACT15_BH24ACT15_10810 [soil metagenome]